MVGRYSSRFLKTMQFVLPEESLLKIWYNSDTFQEALCLPSRTFTPRESPNKPKPVLDRLLSKGDDDSDVVFLLELGPAEVS